MSRAKTTPGPEAQDREASGQSIQTCKSSESDPRGQVMDGFTIGAIFAGVTSTGVLYAGNHFIRSVVLPRANQALHDGPSFEGSWSAKMTGEGNEQFDAHLTIKHYAPYVRGKLQTSKLKDGQVVALSSLRMTGFLCDNYVSMSCRTTIKSRRSVCTLLLQICPQSRKLTGNYVFRALNNDSLISYPVVFCRMPARE